jgi:hypothetical protein
VSRDYLVVYEEDIDGPGEDEVFIDVEMPAEPKKSYEADFSVTVTNKAGILATIGLILAIFGGLVSLFTAAFYILNYPQEWWDTPGDSIPRLTAALALTGTLLLIIGNLLVGFGRQLHAFGSLNAIRFRRE